MTGKTSIYEQSQAYNSPLAGIAEKVIMMEAMIQELERFKKHYGFMPKQWLVVKKLLIKDFKIHKVTMFNWANLDEYTESYCAWQVSKEIRKLYWHCFA